MITNCYTKITEGILSFSICFYAHFSDVSADSCLVQILLYRYRQPKGPISAKGLHTLKVDLWAYKRHAKMITEPRNLVT